MNNGYISPTFFNVVLVIPILNILIFFYNFFSFLKIPGPLGFSIISLTFLINLFLLPLTKKQRLIVQKLNELKPTIDKLSKKYKNDKVKLQQEQIKLYQSAAINPGVSCLLPFIQFAVFIALYKVLSIFLFDHKGVNIVENINKVIYFSFLKIKSIDNLFFGFDLALSPQKVKVWYYLFIPLITGLLQYLQINLMTPKTQPISIDEKKEEKNKDQEDIQKIINFQMRFFIPVFIGYISYTLPVGLALYWNVYSLFNLILYKKIRY